MRIDFIHGIVVEDIHWHLDVNCNLKLILQGVKNKKYCNLQESDTYRLFTTNQPTMHNSTCKRGPLPANTSQSVMY